MLRKRAAICAALYAAAPPALADDWQVGIGLRESVDEEGALIGARFEGGRLLGRRDFGGLAAEAQVYGGLFGSGASSMDHALIAIASASGAEPGLHLQSEEDRLTVALLADWGMGRWQDGQRLGGRGSTSAPRRSSGRSIRFATTGRSTSPRKARAGASGQ